MQLIHKQPARASSLPACEGHPPYPETRPRTHQQVIDLGAAARRIRAHLGANVGPTARFPNDRSRTLGLCAIEIPTLTPVRARMFRRTGSEASNGCAYRRAHEQKQRPGLYRFGTDAVIQTRLLRDCQRRVQHDRDVVGFRMSSQLPTEFESSHVARHGIHDDQVRQTLPNPIERRRDVRNRNRFKTTCTQDVSHALKRSPITIYADDRGLSRQEFLKLLVRACRGPTFLRWCPCICGSRRRCAFSALSAYLLRSRL